MVVAATGKVAVGRTIAYGLDSCAFMNPKLLTFNNRAPSTRNRRTLIPFLQIPRNFTLFAIFGWRRTELRGYREDASTMTVGDEFTVNPFSGDDDGGKELLSN
jgi:hypothetical protein